MKAAMHDPQRTVNVDRAKAIESRGQAAGNSRWMRLTSLSEKPQGRQNVEAEQLARWKTRATRRDQ
jgi:hypothetical protein